jgi:hypothetical protein
MWKKTVVVYFEIMSWHLPGRRRKSYKNPQFVVG